MRFKNILKLLICLILQLKHVENQSCLNLRNWLDFKSKFNIKFYNSSLELIA
jgi:hypothetical protein